jgi:hypothetical protein
MHCMTFWASGFAWSRSGLLMDGLQLQFNIGDVTTLRDRRVFVIVSLPRRRSIQMDAAAKRKEKKKLTNIAKHRILSLLCC